MEIFKANKLILMFPEGIMNKHEELTKFQNGLVTIAHLANVPIYPIYIDPKHHRPFRRQHIMIGEKIDIYQQCKELNTQSCEALTKTLYDYVNSMKQALELELSK